MIVTTEGNLSLGSQNPRLFFWIVLSYLLASLVGLVVVQRWRHAFHQQLTFQVIADAAFLTLLMFSSGGGKSGLAMMVLVALVGAGLVGQGRMVLFYAAMATVFLLAEQAYRVLRHQGEVSDFFTTGLTSVGFFGSAVAARLLASRVVANEELARKRGIELADQMRINERVIRDMQDGVLVVDVAGRVRQANPQAGKLMGLTTPVPLTLADCLPALVREYQQKRTLGFESETVIQVPQTGRALRVRFLPAGTGGNTLIYIEDIGRLQQEAQQVKLAALGRLTANMAHEIRNPLAAISHAAELLADEPAAGAERLVRIIGDNTQRLNRLVIEVMELGRRDRASPEQIYLHEFLVGVVEEISLHDTNPLNRIQLDLPAEATVIFDRGHLHRVVSNLLGNALGFASESTGAVRLIGSTDDVSHRFMLHFIDDGPGIDETSHTQVFEPFFTTRSSGTGLGLYIARELSEANGAQLVLLENAPGAHFCLSCVSTWQDMNPLPAVQA